jgi:putative DNA primase/helicase
MTAAEIARAFGAARRSGPWWRCRCPVHNSRSPSLSLRDGDRGLVVHCHAGCDPRDVRAELRRRGLLPGAIDHRPMPIPTRNDARDDTARRIAAARRIWDTAHDARGSPVTTYLAGRGITVDPPPSLRWAPALRRPDGTNGPAMIARIDSIDGELIGIARTWLAHDAAGSWCRRDRAMLGRAAGGAVRLASAAETLLIGEGIETTSAGIQATGLPGWAALSTSGMVALILPPAVRNIVILADHDSKGAGERAARIAQTHWRREGRRVSVWISPRSGEDANDCLLAALGAERRDVAA